MRVMTPFLTAGAFVENLTPVTPKWVRPKTAGFSFFLNKKKVNTQNSRLFFFFEEKKSQYPKRPAFLL